MSFKKEKIRDIFLLTTEVENIFINEYMPAAPGDFVKVYMYGLLYSDSNEPMSTKKMSRQLGMPVERIKDAWDYWLRMGVVRQHGAGAADEDPTIEFVQLRSLMYDSHGETAEAEAPDESPLRDENLRELIFYVEKTTGRTLSPRQTEEIFSWIDDCKASPEVIVKAVEYCTEKGKTGINYISKVVRQWAEEGLQTREDVSDYLNEAERQQGASKRILHTLGLNRGATEAERQMIDRWFKEMEFNMDRILEACERASFISSPNLRYVNKILENWYQEAKADGRSVNKRVVVTQAVLNKYYEHLRHKAEEEAEERRKEIYGRLPRISEIDREISSLGQRLSKAVLTGSSRDTHEIKRLMELLKEERAVLLTENNYRADYTDVKYKCSLCNDTGITPEGVRCVCVKERMGEAEVWQNSDSSKTEK